MGAQLTAATCRVSGVNDRRYNKSVPFLRSTACSLKEACCEIGRDDYGRRCQECPLRALCEDESRWLIQRDCRDPGRLN